RELRAGGDRMRVEGLDLAASALHRRTDRVLHGRILGVEGCDRRGTAAVEGVDVGLQRGLHGLLARHRHGSRVTYDPAYPATPAVRDRSFGRRAPASRQGKLAAHTAEFEGDSWRKRAT